MIQHISDLPGCKTVYRIVLGSSNILTTAQIQRNLHILCLKKEIN